MTQWYEFWQQSIITMTPCSTARMCVHLFPWRTERLGGQEWQKGGMRVGAGLCNRLIKFKFPEIKEAGKHREGWSYSSVSEWVAEVYPSSQTERLGLPRSLWQLCWGDKVLLWGPARNRGVKGQIKSQSGGNYCVMSSTKVQVFFFLVAFDATMPVP